MRHPYMEYSDLKAWKVLEKSIAELEKNNDIELKTPKEYVIGYLLKKLLISGELIM